MSATPDTQASQQRLVVILLAVIAALLVGIVVMIVVKGNALPEPDTALIEQQRQAQEAAASAPTSVPPAFDPASATEVPEGTEPAEYAAEYYEAILASDFEKAFYMQPAHKQSGDVGSFQAQLESYNMTGFDVLSEDDQGDTYTVVVDQVTGFGTFENVWEFAKSDSGDTWLVKDRTIGAIK